MRPVRRFEVLPTIPDALAALPELVTNLHWTWDPEAIRLFQRLWPGWTAGQAHPAEMLRTTRPERLAELAADPSVVDDLGAVSRKLRTALTATTWFESRRGSPLRSHRLLLAGVRHHRGTPAVLRRPGRPRRRSPEGVV